jgi:hypothetical protein
MPRKKAPDINACGTCRCFVAEPKDAEGECRRYPPVPLVVDTSVIFVFPSVTRTSICGEFAQRLQS